jgi:hypothetical protein
LRADFPSQKKIVSLPKISPPRWGMDALSGDGIPGENRPRPFIRVE